jgi:predicted TIM-barrel enzyme/transcriptional regulator with AAA-type ATPase domain
MTAEAAERGGADFLLALSAGRYRVMGAASLAALLPLGAANSFTDGFARREILDRVSIPVFFGGSCFDPSDDLDELIARVRTAGYAGIANFPTATHFDGSFREALEGAEIGFSREVELLRRAREAGLATFGYAKTRKEVTGLLEAQVDMLCLNFGWNAGGVISVAQSFTIAEAADRARRILMQVRAARPETLCFVEGGPIISPDDMFRVCTEARADGYVGGSTLDRMPLEVSVTEKTSAFKAFGLLREAGAAQSRELERAARIAGVIGQSEAVQALLERVVKLARTGLPVLIDGEQGLGRARLARAVHVLSERQGPLLTVSVADWPDPEGMVAMLFGEPQKRGGLLARSGATLIIENAERLGPALQRQLADWLEHDGFWQRVGSRATPPVRLVFVRQTGRSAPTASMVPALSRQLTPGRIEIAPLRDRPEDLPALARHVLMLLQAGGEGQRRKITPDGYRVLLAHAWPGNIPELRGAIEAAAVANSDGTIGSVELSAAIGTTTPASTAPATGMDEREWLLDALRRNRFRRGDTAAYLGLSRKTLYNRMRRAGLLE